MVTFRDTHFYKCLFVSFPSLLQLARSMRLYNWIVVWILDHTTIESWAPSGHALYMLWNQELLSEYKYTSVNFWILISPWWQNLWVYWIIPCFKSPCLQKVLWPLLVQELDLNIYSPNASSTSINVPCNSTLCPLRDQCSTTRNTCPYQISYLSNGTSSTGFLVEDMLHLVSDDDELKVADARITFG